MLLAGGCSYVWGDELEGFIDNSHHEKTVVAKLADHLDVPYKNLAIPGNGNQKIFRDIVDYLNSPKGDEVTHMVILWSYWGREEFAEPLSPEEEKKFRLTRQDCMSQVSKERIYSLKPPLRGDVTKMYEREGYKKSSLMRGLSCMVAMKLIAESRGIKLVQSIFHPINWKYVVSCLAENDERYDQFKMYLKKTMRSLPHHHRIGMTNIGEDIKTFERKSDLIECPQGHPGEDAHRLYAEYLFKEWFQKVDWDKN
jgi:hypothetical protein